MNIFKKGKHYWWQTPKIRTDENTDKERKASWLELFYDLMFVTIIAQLSVTLYKHVSFSGIVAFILLFIPAWWIWNSITFYNERYEMNDIRHRVFTFLNMIPLAGISFSISGINNGRADIFAISYIISRLLLIYLWFTAGESKIERKLSWIFSIGFSISVMIWIGSIYAPIPYKFIMWGCGIMIDMITPMVTLKTQSKLPKISTSHIPERFGLLVILTIGETIIASVNGLNTKLDLNLSTAFSCILGLCISFLIWWLYIDHVMYRVFKRNVWHILGWSYLHLPLTISITAVGSGILAVFASSPNSSVPAPVYWLLCSAVASTLLVIALLGVVSENKDHQHGVISFHKQNNQALFFFKIASSFLAIAVGFIGYSLTAISLLGILTFILVIPAIQGLRLWINSHIKLNIQHKELDLTNKTKYLSQSITG